MSRKSLQTPQNRRSMLGFGSATAKMKQMQKKPPEQKRLSYSANRSANMHGRKWSQGTHQMKDTRPLSNRSYQKQMIEDIVEFLNETGYPHPISTKVLSAPTTKEFLRVFEHLYGLINTDFKMDKKFEEEVPRILKSLGYPFTLSKSAMFAIGSLHTWPTILGALQWLVDCLRMVNSVDVERLLFPVDAVEDELPVLLEKTFFEYNSQTYYEFLMGRDDMSEARKQLEQTLQHNDLKEEVEFLEQELLQLENEGDAYEEALRQKSLLEEKLSKHEDKLQQLEQKEEVLDQQKIQLVAQAKDEGGIEKDQWNEMGIDLPKLGDPSHQEEIKYKSSEVKQHLQRFNMEKERLELQNNEREMKYSKLYDKSLEIINKYNDLAQSLTRSPIISKCLGDNALELYCDHNQKDSTKLNEVKDKLKYLLFQITNHVKEERYQVDAQNITLEEKYDKQTQLYLEKKHEASQLKTKLLGLEKSCDTHIENLDTDYESQTTDLLRKQDLLDAEFEQIKSTLDKEMAELEKLKTEFDESSYQHEVEQNELANSLTTFIQEAEKRKKRIEDGLNSLNGILKKEIQSIQSQLS